VIHKSFAQALSNAAKALAIPNFLAFLEPVVSISKVTLDHYDVRFVPFGLAIERANHTLPCRRDQVLEHRIADRVAAVYFTEYLVNAPPAWLNEFGPSAA
jgi:hypothetical protein